MGGSSPSQKGASRAGAAPPHPHEWSPDTAASGLPARAVGPAHARRGSDSGLPLEVWRPRRHRSVEVAPCSWKRSGATSPAVQGGRPRRQQLGSHRPPGPRARPRERSVPPAALTTGFSLTRASARSPLAATPLDLSGSRGPCLAPSVPSEQWCEPELKLCKRPPAPAPLSGSEPGEA